MILDDCKNIRFFCNHIINISRVFSWKSMTKSWTFDEPRSKLMEISWTISK